MRLEREIKLRFPDPAAARAAIATLGAKIASVHVHDNHGFKDEHLWPGDGTIGWPATAEALKALGVHKVRLLSNNPDKVAQLEKAGIEVVERVPCRPRTSRHSEKYLRTKKRKMGHLLAGL